ncbi:Flavoprotein [Frankia canadensis]|uniref:Flavoprotein n=1 Tax=Frankia canadensis TaxID=1836972 RepID=A0A2I2KMA5_9ACTN|nr:flavoprotein [Frankia canadensis]SNQ46807.1 Flavoprotein [Frankia canadensis]SOU54097.1 Flavoprotein [Frankia canadensis]
MAGGSRVLYVVACGGYPAAELPDFVTHARGVGWDVCAVVTPAATGFVDVERLAELTGHPVRAEYKRPGEPDVLPPADAFVVAPATFNTVNKLVAGISDTLALGLLNEALGAGLPIVVAPYPNSALAGHPAYAASLAALREWGVRLVFGAPGDPRGGADQAGRENTIFPWPELRDIVRTL